MLESAVKTIAFDLVRCGDPSEARSHPFRNLLALWLIWIPSETEKVQVQAADESARPARDCNMCNGLDRVSAAKGDTPDMKNSIKAICPFLGGNEGKPGARTLAFTY